MQVIKIRCTCEWLNTLSSHVSGFFNIPDIVLKLGMVFEAIHYIVIPNKTPQIYEG